MSKLRLDTSSFDSSEAQSLGNRAKKLIGSYGLTAVIPMPVAMDAVVKTFVEELTKRQRLFTVQPNLTGSEPHVDNKFVDSDGFNRTNESRVIAPIECLHTTIAAWHVMDAVSESTWINELIRSRLCSQLAIAEYDVFADGFYRSLIYDRSTNTSTENYLQSLQDYIEQASDDIDKVQISNMLQYAKENYMKPFQNNMNIEHIKPFVLKAESIKLNNDGNILIQWSSSEALKRFRQELLKHGGLAKWGENIGTTIAYFPNWHKLSAPERQSIRYDIENILTHSIISERISALETMLVEPEKLIRISFSRNNLSANSAGWDTALAIFDEDNSLNPSCLSTRSYDEIRSELQPLRSPVSVVDPLTPDESAAFLAYKNRFKPVLDELEPIAKSDSFSSKG